MRSAAVLAAVAIVIPISGCITIQVPKVTPGNYPNYREMLVAQMEVLPFAAPKDLIRRFSICGADVTVDHLTPAELERLDRFARGELKLADSELKELDSDLRDRIGGEDGLGREMNERCPEVVKEADAYKKSTN